MKISGISKAPLGELACSVPEGHYVDMYNLVEVILKLMNLEIYQYKKHYGIDDYYNTGYETKSYRYIDTKMKGAWENIVIRKDDYNVLEWKTQWVEKPVANYETIITRSYSGPFQDWIECKGHWMRAHPQMFRMVDDGRMRGSGSGTMEPFDKLFTPPGWDINYMDGRYIAAVIENGKIIFKAHNIGFYLKLAFCKELAYLMGVALNYQDLVWLDFPQMDKLHVIPKPKFHDKAVEWSVYGISLDYTSNESFEAREGFLYSKYDGYSKTTSYKFLEWNIYVDQSIPIKYEFDLWRNTIRSIYVCCNIVEQTHLGCNLALPLLRIIPSESIHDTHSTHSFIIPQFKKVLCNQVNQIKIWLMEEVSTIYELYDVTKPYTFSRNIQTEFKPLTLDGDVIMRLEFIKNAK